jgi:signal transduction histidine kinase
VAAVVLALVVTELAGTRASGTEATTLAAYLLAVAFTVPYVFHRDHPVAALVVTCAATIAYSLGHYAGYPGFAMFVMVFGLTLHTERGKAVLFYLAGLVTLSVSLALQREGVATASTWVSTILVLTVAWLAGENLRARRARWSALEERARRLEEEREQQARAAVQEERMRIARELHDVVAHSMSVVAVQAGVAHHVIDRRPELAQEALAAIETTSRSALVELRRMLGVLRRPGETGAAFEPSSGLDDLETLVRQLDDAGVKVELRVEGGAGAVPPGVGLSAYRVAQEALTNVLKHGADIARLNVTCRGDAVVVEVTDPGRGERAGEPVPGAGHGMLGMRERVAVFGGRLETGPDGHGGFRVLATLPHDAAGLTDHSAVPLDNTR